jgi:hypothetical protein
MPPSTPIYVHLAVCVGVAIFKSAMVNRDGRSSARHRLLCRTNPGMFFICFNPVPTPRWPSLVTARKGRMAGMSAHLRRHTTKVGSCLTSLALSKPTLTFITEAAKAFIGSLSSYHFNMILSGACVCLVCLIISILMFRQATHLSKPREQIK